MCKAEERQSHSSCLPEKARCFVALSTREWEQWSWGLQIKQNYTINIAMCCCCCFAAGTFKGLDVWDSCLLLTISQSFCASTYVYFASEKARTQVLWRDALYNLQRYQQWGKILLVLLLTGGNKSDETWEFFIWKFQLQQPKTDRRKMCWVFFTSQCCGHPHSMNFSAPEMRRELETSTLDSCFESWCAWQATEYNPKGVICLCGKNISQS